MQDDVLRAPAARISAVWVGVLGLALALLVSLLTAPPAHAASVSEVEPNATTAQAQSLPLSTTVNASFRTTGDCDNTFYDCDVYRIAVAASGKLTIDLRFSDALGLDGSFQLTLTGPDGTTIDNETVSATDYNGSRLRSVAIFVGAGNHYLTLKARVSGFGSGYIWSGQPYTLAVKSTAVRSESEPNSSSATADAITLGSTTKGSVLYGSSVWGLDADYYRLSVPAQTKLTIDFRFACDLGAGSDLYDIEVHTTAGYLWTFSPQGGDCEGAALRAKTFTAPAGNVYIMVDSSFRTGRVVRGKEYSLTVRGILTAPAPTMSGTVKVGSTLTAVPGTWGPKPVTLSYQWLRNGAAISGATGTTYKLTTADAGKKVSVRVTGRKTAYSTKSMTSSAKSVPLLTLKASTPTISGTLKVGSKLTAKPGTWTAGTTFSYQWYSGGTKVSGATSSTYTIRSADKGHTLKVTVTGKKAAYASVSKTSASTSTVK
ncbi:hypothetical protein [Microbacterium jejuense]|uniref:hypothetical protein n=1 Tax=Microbacterium jejuense TaxID=1263637 RepID=UPI0031EB8AF0